MYPYLAHRSPGFSIALALALTAPAVMADTLLASPTTDRLTAPQVAQAADDQQPAEGSDGTLSIGAHISTLGPGVSASTRINDYVGITGLVNYLPYSTSGDIDEVSYDVDLRFLTIGAQADLYPMPDTGLRLSAGAFINQNRADLSARISGQQTISIDGETYTASDIGGLDGSVDFDALAPYISIGYQAQVTSGLSIAIDGGAVYQGEPDVSLSARDLNPALPAATRQEIIDDIAREENNAQSDLAAFDLYPMVRASLSWRF